MYVRFGTSISGECYCFDFGAGSTEPSVVTWPTGDCYWRRVAPNFAAFMALFIDAREVPICVPSSGERAGSYPSPRSLVATWAPQYVMIDDEASRPFFEELADDYAECSPSERREVEEEVRKELESRGLSDEQRRRLDQLWSQLRASVA
jgi:hypothetical protein